MKMWRAKHFYLPVGLHHRLVVSVRRFKVKKNHRSAKYRQLILPVNIGGVRQVAVRIQRLGRKKSVSPTLRAASALPAILIILGIAGMGFFGNQIMSSHRVLPSRTFATVANRQPNQPVIKSMPASVPTHINIPSVGIDVNIVSVGKDTNGAVALPSFNDWVAGWYKYSPTPGQVGPSVIVGHLDTYTSTSVFWNLNKITPGALIYISRKDGSTAVFKTTALTDVSQNNFPTQKVYGNINYPGLRLITCSGTYEPALGHYNENLVVYATLKNN